MQRRKKRPCFCILACKKTLCSFERRMTVQFVAVNARLDALQATLTNPQSFTTSASELPPPDCKSMRCLQQGTVDAVARKPPPPDCTSMQWPQQGIVDMPAAIPCQVGLTVAATLTCKAVLVACEQLEREGSADGAKLRRAHELLQPPFSAQPAAKAYELVLAVKKSCPLPCAELCRLAALRVRETLVLELCCTTGAMSDIGFAHALEHSFGRPLETLVHSQIFLARRRICSMGRDHNEFKRAAVKVWEASSSDQKDALFSAYTKCTSSLDSVSSAPKAASRAQNRRKKAQKAVASEGIACVDSLPQE